MSSLKIYDFLSRLDGREQRQFKKFCFSPYFNETEEIKPLLHLLCSQDVFPDNRAIHDCLYPGEVFKDLRIRHLLSHLQKLGERFLAIRQFEKRPLLRQTLLLEALRGLNLEKHYRHQLRKAQTLRSKQSQDPDLYLSFHLLEKEQNAWLEQAGARSLFSNLQATSDTLDAYYILSKLKYACTFLNNRNIVDFDLNNRLLSEILALLEKEDFSSVTAIPLYTQVYKMLLQPEEEQHFYQLKELLDQHDAAFSAGEARDLYALAQNYCIGRINRGRGEFLRELFELYRRVLERKIIFREGWLPPSDLKNIVVVGLRLEEYDWVEKFIEKYHKKITPDFRENAYTYNLAKLYFYRKEYSRVLRLLREVEYEDLFYNLDSKTMLLKIYFEWEEVEALDSLARSFLLYLQRNKTIAEKHKRTYIHLVRFVRKLSRLRPGDQVSWQNLGNKIESTPDIADRKWLLEKWELGGSASI